MYHLFRFHTGSIKSYKEKVIVLKDFPCFDSILVRLKVCYDKSLSPNLHMFRFHTGSIKSLQ